MKTKHLFRKSLFVIFTLILLPLWGQNPVIKNLKPIQPADFKVVKSSVHPVALQAIRKGIKPATFKGVKTRFNPSVKLLSKQKTVLIKEKLKNGLLLPQAVKQIQIKPGKIYMDPESKTVFKPVQIGKDSMILWQPPLNVVLTEFKIPHQTVKINLANTTYTAKGTEVTEEKTASGDYLLKMEFKDTLYHYKKEIKKKNSKTNAEISLHLTGHLYLENPEVEAAYSANDGYYIKVNLHENADIQAKLDATLKSELEFPLWSFDIPAGDYGSCQVGIYAFIDMNGELHLSYKIEQDIRITAGVEGKTLAFAPKSYDPIINIQKSLKTDYEIKAQLKVFGGVEAKADIKVLKYGLVELIAKAGPEAEIKLVDNGKNFEAKAGARFKITSKFNLDLKYKKIKKDYTLYDKYYLLWEYKKKNYGGYIMEVKSADVYNDRVWGTVVKEDDKSPYQGKVKIIVKHNGQLKNTYTTTTDEKGVFAKDNIPLVKGDTVQIRIDGVPNDSPPVAATLPFKEIRLFYADYYTNRVEGSIASKIDMYPKHKSTHTATPVRPNIPVHTGINTIVNNKVLTKSVKIDENLFKNAITYNGDIEVVTIPGIHKIDKKIPGFIINGKNKKNKKYKSKFPKPVLNPATIKYKKKVINLPFGNFVVNNVDIKPYDRVKVRINVDGFVLESNTVVADGLVITPSVDVNKQGGIKKPEIKAEDSYVMVNGLRSNVPPTGKIRMLKGIDMRHTSPHKDYPGQKITFPKLKMFPQAVHPLVFYDVTANLKPSSKRGFAEAHTGPWQVKNIFYDLKHTLQLQKFDGHRFEYIEYDYENLPVKYQYYQKTCAMDKDFLNINNKSKDYMRLNKRSKIPHKNIREKTKLRIH